MNIEDHVRGMKPDCGIRMGGKVFKKLFAFFIIDSVPLASSLAIVVRAMRTVRLTVCA
jgi:hypothetical protein